MIIKIVYKGCSLAIIPLGREGLELRRSMNFRLSHEKSSILGTDYSDHNSTSKQPLALLWGKVRVEIHQ
jgi:hypothetical protein